MSSSSTTNQELQPQFGDIQIDEAAARSFSQNIGRVINLAHLVPSLVSSSQKFQLEQAASAVSFERMTPAEREACREQHFIDGLKRGYDFCLTTAKAALDEALKRGVPNSPTTSSVSANNNNNEDLRSSSVDSNSVKNNSNKSPTNQQQQFPKIQQSGFNENNLMERASSMPQLSSCEDFTAQQQQHQKNSENHYLINDSIIQCIAELSHYSIEVLQQVFLVSKNNKIRIHLREYAAKQQQQVSNTSSEAAQSSSSSSSTELSTNKFTEYIRSAFSASREIELAWFAEGFRTAHMNLLCNALFDCPMACRNVLNCDGLIMLILFHGKHLDPENPGLNEWSAFAMRTIVQVVPEAGAMIDDLKRRVQQVHANKQQDSAKQKEEEEKMRQQMRQHEQEFM